MVMFFSLYITFISLPMGHLISVVLRNYSSWKSGTNNTVTETTATVSVLKQYLPGGGEYLIFSSDDILVRQQLFSTMHL